MDNKRWAVFFIFLLSTNYVASAVGCQMKPEVTDMFDKCFDNARNEIEDSYTIKDDIVTNIQLTSGSVSNLKNFKRVLPLSCICLSDRIRIFIQLSFIDVTVTWLITVLDGLLGGLLGNLGRTVTRLLGQMVNLVLNILCLEINVVIAVDQPFLPGSTCFVSSFHVTRISSIRILNIDLTQLLVGLLGDLLTPMVNTVVTQVISSQVRLILVQGIQKLSITSQMHNCGGK